MRLGIIVLALALAACSTPYESSGLLGGFEETQLGPNIWRVSFTGNGFTSPEKTQDFAVLRSAELALQNGYSYFGFASAGVRSNFGGIMTTPGYSSTTANATVSGNSIYGTANTVSYPGSAYAWTYPTANNTVVMFREQPQANGMIYDARFVCRSLGAKYKVQCKGAA